MSGACFSCHVLGGTVLYGKSLTSPYLSLPLLNLHFYSASAWYIPTQTTQTLPVNTYSMAKYAPVFAAYDDNPGFSRQHHLLYPFPMSVTFSSTVWQPEVTELDE